MNKNNRPGLKPKFKIPGYHIPKDSEKPNPKPKHERAYLPPLPDHLKKFTEPPFSMCARYHEFKETINSLRDKWEAIKLTEEEERYRFFEAINGLVICARMPGTKAGAALYFLTCLLDMPIIQITNKFLIDNDLHDARDIIKDDLLHYAREMVTSYILGDQLRNRARAKEIKPFFEDSKASEERHLKLVNRELRHFYKTLLNTIRINEWVDDSSDSDEEEMIRDTDPLWRQDKIMIEAVKSLACREGEDLNQYFNDAFLKKHKLTGGIGYNPYYLTSEQANFIDNYKHIQFWYDRFNDGELKEFKTKNELDSHIEENDLVDTQGNKTSIKKIIAGIQAIPRKEPSIYAYLKVGLLGRLNQLYKFLKNREIPIKEAFHEYRYYTEGLKPDNEDADIKYQNNKELQDMLHSGDQEKHLQELDYKDILEAVKKVLTKKQIEIFDSMTNSNYKITKVAEELGCSVPYVSTEWSKIKKKFSKPPISDLIKS